MTPEQQKEFNDLVDDLIWDIRYDNSAEYAKLALKAFVDGMLEKAWQYPDDE